MGRTSLLMVIAFNMTFMMMGFRLSTASSAAYEKYCGYADVEQANLAMESASNIAISYALLDIPSSAEIPRISQSLFNKTGSSFSVTQYPKFDTFGTQIGESLSVKGKYPLTGVSPLAVLDKDKYVLGTTYVIVTGNSFSQYVFYSVTEGTIYWGTGDTCRGRLHTQDKLLVNGGADFKGRVTTKKGVTISGSPAPNFEKGYTKADVSLPTDLINLNQLGDPAHGGRFIKGINTYVEFLGDGRVTVRTGALGWTETSTAMNPSPNGTIPKCTTYASTTELAASGVLLVQNAELHVKGQLDGKITLGCVDTTKMAGSPPALVYSGMSKVFIDNSVTYKAPPPCDRFKDRVSDDMLGIVATNDIMVSRYVDHTSSTTLKNVEINASMFSLRGGFGAESYDVRGDCGKLTVIGGMQQNLRRAVGVQSTPQQGFKKDYDFDTNLELGAPAGYPTTKFLIKNWVDRTSIPEKFWQ